MSRNVRKRRDKLWLDKKGKCYWCDIDTIVPDRGNGKATPKSNWATLDHLRTRLDPNRQEPNNTNEERTVLCCWSCNNCRGRLCQLASQDISVFVNESNIRYLDDN